MGYLHFESSYVSFGLGCVLCVFYLLCILVSTKGVGDGSFNFSYNNKDQKITILITYASTYNVTKKNRGGRPCKMGR
jgi:hypothetical protein